jgi:hypothetical protein
MEIKIPVTITVTIDESAIKKIVGEKIEEFPGYDLDDDEPARSKEKPIIYKPKQGKVRMKKRWTHWTTQEEKMLRDNIDLPMRHLKRMLGRKAGTIKRKIKTLDLTRKTRDPISGLLNANMPTKSVTYDFGIKRGKMPRWTKKELSYIKDNSDKSFEELGSILGRGPKGVWHKMREMGIAHKRVKKEKVNGNLFRKPYERRRNKNWTGEERAFMKNNKHLGIPALAKILGRTRAAVATQLSIN